MKNNDSNNAIKTVRKFPYECVRNCGHVKMFTCKNPYI